MSQVPPHTHIRVQKVPQKYQTARNWSPRETDVIHSVIHSLCITIHLSTYLSTAKRTARASRSSLTRLCGKPHTANTGSGLGGLWKVPTTPSRYLRKVLTTFSEHTQPRQTLMTTRKTHTTNNAESPHAIGYVTYNSSYASFVPC